MFAASKTAGAVSAAPPASSDPQFNYVSLLLNDTGTNGQQNNTFLDSSSNNFTITRNGTPTQGSVTPYWPDGQWSNQFSGSGQYLTVPYSTAMLPQSGTNFTAECWVYLTGATAAFQFILGMNSSTQANWAIKNENGTLQGSIGNAFGNFGPAVANTWVHLAIVQNNNTLVGYLNGVQSFSQAITSWTSTSLVVSISARSSAGDRAFPGYVSNVRIVKGTALYTGNFTPSTTPLTAVSGTSLLTCQSNRFKDNSSNNFAITVTGTPTVQSFEPFEPASSYATSVGGSGYFPGATTSFLSLAQNTAFDFGAGDFTVEAWIYPLATTQQAIVGKWTGTGQVAWIAQINPGSSNIQFAYGNAGAFTANVTFSGTIKSNNWSHVAFTRSGTSVRAFINGVQAGTTQTIAAVMTATNANLVVGKVESDNNNAFNGYISNLRIVPGTAVYTSAFTPPTSPVTAITGTSLLLNFTNAGIYDAATLNDLVTVGNAQVSTAQAKFGSSSMAFVGNGDYLTFPYTPQANLGSGNFTVEGWVYLSSLSGDVTLAAVQNWGDGYAQARVALLANGSARFLCTSGSTTWINTNTTASGVFTTGNWIHFAAVRNGSSFNLYVNGTSQLSYTSSATLFNNSAPSIVGSILANGTPVHFLNGYIDDLRITKGYARYTANFTPPTAPFPTR